MKCARLQLQKRSHSRGQHQHDPGARPSEKTRRYCQRRLVDPHHEEDSRWTGTLAERFRCNIANVYDPPSEQPENDTIEDLFLSVQTLKFQGDTQENKRPRTCFKYKASNQSQHRMFVRQTIDGEENFDDDDSSQQTSTYYFDDYVKYILNSERSRPASSRSSLILCGKTNANKTNKATQMDVKHNVTDKPEKKAKPKRVDKVPSKARVSKSDEKKEVDDVMEDTKVSYQKTAKRKSITISRANPETLQIIRVDVVCNYSRSSSVLSEADDFRAAVEKDEKIVPQNNVTKNHFANKYLLTKSVKTLDENLSGGSKVTLLCKTYRLTDRCRPHSLPRDSKCSGYLRFKGTGTK